MIAINISCWPETETGRRIGAGPRGGEHFWRGGAGERILVEWRGGAGETKNNLGRGRVEWGRFSENFLDLQFHVKLVYAWYNCCNKSCKFVLIDVINYLQDEVCKFERGDKTGK